MIRLHASPILLAAIALAIPAGNACQADLVRLKTGGELRGKVLNERESEAGNVSIRTVAGALVTVPRKQVEFVARRSMLYEEYELKARLTPATVEDQWSLAEWCVANRLMRQRDIHLENILELDPENAAAHQGLGHVQRNGSWTTHEEDMLARGYVKYRGRYITPEEKMLLDNSQQDREKQLAWYEKIRVWSNWLTGRYDGPRQKAINALADLTDPHAVPALQNFFGDKTNRDVRIVYINTLGQIASAEAVNALIELAVSEDDQGLRIRAIDQIPQEANAQAAQTLVSYLQNDNNLVVRRAASALKSLGDSQAVPYLIEALVTTHKYRYAVDAPAVGVTLGPGGVTSGLQAPLLPPGLEAGLRTGLISPENIIPPQNPVSIKQWRTVRVDQQNPEVLEALNEITQVNFGYDERTWKLWWMSQNS